MAQEHRSAGDVLSDVFTQAKEGFMSFGETIANKSKEAYDSAKLNTQKAQLESENEEYYKKLGKMVKDQEQYTDEMKDIGKKIDENESEIQKLEAQLNGEDEKEDSEKQDDRQEQPKNSMTQDDQPSGQGAMQQNAQASASGQSEKSEQKYEHKENPVTGTSTDKTTVKNDSQADASGNNGKYEQKHEYKENPITGSQTEKTTVKTN